MKLAGSRFTAKSAEMAISVVREWSLPAQANHSRFTTRKIHAVESSYPAARCMRRGNAAARRRLAQPALKDPVGHSDRQQAGICAGCIEALVLSTHRPRAELPLDAGAEGKTNIARAAAGSGGGAAGIVELAGANTGERVRGTHVRLDAGHARLDVHIDDGDRQIEQRKRGFALLRDLLTGDRGPGDPGHRLSRSADGVLAEIHVSGFGPEE